MDCYTKAVTVSIKNCSAGPNQVGSKITTRSIKIPVIKPRPNPFHATTNPFQRQKVAPFSDLTNIRKERSSSSSKAPLHKIPLHTIPLSPRTNANNGDDYTIKRTPTATRLFLFEDQGNDENDPFGLDFITKGNLFEAFEGFVNAWKMVHL